MTQAIILFTKKAHTRILLLSSLVLILLTFQAYAAKPPVFATAEGAIEGYDPVSYYIAAKPQKGLDDFSFEWMGATFKFSTADNLALFKANPEMYAPQYGGYCAYAVSKGSTASTVPEAWTIVDGKLYLNFSKGVRTLWSLNKSSNIKKANQNWPSVLE